MILLSSARACGCLVVAIGFAVPGIVSAQADPAAPFLGTWSGVFTTQQNEFWRIEDFTCFAGCPPEAYDHLTALLDDAANDDRPIDALTGETRVFMRERLASISTSAGVEKQQAVTTANDPTLHCAPYGFVREATNPLPLRILRDGEHVVIDYEEWNLERTIYMDGRAHPADPDPALLGHSIGRFEGGALVVETVGVEPDIYYSFLSGGGYSEELTGVERYTIRENPRRLHLELTVEDPVTLTEPYTIEKTWLWTPDVELVEDSCEDVPGVF